MLLALDAPAVTAQLAILSDYAVARDRDCDSVGGAGPCYGSGRRRHADLFGYGAIGTGFSAWDLLQGLPNAALKRGRSNIQRERGIGFASLKQASQIHPPLGHSGIVAAAGGEGEFAHQALLELAIVVGELDGTDAFVGGGDEHASQG